MICPYCNKEMEKGYIEDLHNRIVWVTWGHMREPIERIFKSFDTHAIRLGRYDIARAAKVVAYCCRDCEKIIIDIPNSKPLPIGEGSSETADA